MAGANATSFDLPPLPDYTLKPLTPLSSWASDALITAALPVVGYWVVSLMFHAIDVYDWFPQYRLHTPAEVLKRNHVSRYEVLRDVILQQIIQIAFSLGLAYFDETPTAGKADHDVAWYAQKLRLVQRAVPYVMSTVGLDPTGIATKFVNSQPVLASIAMGGQYPGLLQTVTVAGKEMVAPAFASWELTAASFIYWYGVPAIQFCAAIVIIDAWEYMLHRAMHMNKWLYGEFRNGYWANEYSNVTSHLPLTPPPSVRTVCVWRTLQPSPRGICSGHSGCRSRLLAHGHDHATVYVVLHWIDHQDGARPWRLCLPLGPRSLDFPQQRRLPRHPPPELGHQDQLLSALLHLPRPARWNNVQG